MEFWCNAEKTEINKIRKIYNKILRVCGGDTLSTPIEWQCISNKMLDFDEMRHYLASEAWIYCQYCQLCGIE